MFKKTSLVFVLMLTIFLSGCTFPWNKPITEIVYQEDKTIDNLQDFLSEAQVIADKQIGTGAQIKIIYYSYFDNVFSYDVTFSKDGDILKNNIVKNIDISYNKDWEIQKEDSILSHVSKEAVNNKIIAVECNSSIYCASGLANAMADPKNNIDINSIKFSLNNLIRDSYLTGHDSGFIKNINGIPIGNFGKFRFNAVTGDIVDGTAININKWYEEQTGSALDASETAEKSDSMSISNDAAVTSETTSTSTVEILAQNFNNDSDEDGLSNLQEAGYETDSDMDDTDNDGHTDGEEINNGYNPLGSGKLISDDCLINSETDKCYLEMAKVEKDVSFCQKISTQKEVFQCLFRVNLITKNPQICEDSNKAPENDIPDFYNVCLNELVSIANPIVPVVPIFDRDARTIADVKQIQTALEMYYNDLNGYPESLEALTTSDYKLMNILPTAIKGESDTCSKDYNYKYTFISREDYSLTYCIDGISNVAKDLGIISGLGIATPMGIQ